MQQNENEENVVYAHNLRGSAPSSFADVKDETLRTYNRGAVLANIFERYVNPKTGKMEARDLTMCLREIHEYLVNLPEPERQHAHASMFVHLENRGYRERKNTHTRH